jgi:hypothetical protein
MYPILAEVWYVLTLGRLGEFTLQHLIVLTSALAGTFGFYVAARKLMPDRRWICLAFAFLYLAVPSWLAVVVNVEDYMSYMAFAVMPLVLYGNAKSVLRSDGRGYVPLGIGLALIWMCHPPIAFLACMVTLFIQSGAALSRGFAQWRGLAACAATFVILAAYYFVSMSELPRSTEGTPLFPEICTILGLAVFFAGAGRCALKPRNPGWVVCTLIASVAVGIGSRPWLIWISCSTAFWIATVLVVRRTKSIDLDRHAFSMLFVCFLLGSASAQLLLGPDHVGAHGSSLNFLSDNTRYLAGLFLPLPNPFSGIALLQLGWGLDLALAAGVLALFGRRPLGAKVFFAASLGLVICSVRVPLVSDFLVGYFPFGFSSTFGLPLALRIAPVVASFTAMAGVLWFATLEPGHRYRRTTSALLALLVGWSGYQATRFDQSARSMTSTQLATENSLRSENTALSRYAYDLEQIPGYYSNGMSDPALETRLLDASGNIVFGPMEAAKTCEQLGARRIRLTCKPFAGSNWIDIEPRITVEPGEHVLVRFEFDPNRTYNGYLLMISEHGYREYHLPDSGFNKAFGIGGAQTTVVSLWNSGKEAEHYSFSNTNEPGNSLEINGGLFANVIISEFARDSLPIRLESLIPYRATVSTATGGWLETFIVYLPGYHAWVDGHPVSVVKSAESLAEFQVPPGEHSVELRFVGTRRLWFAAVVSIAGWIVLCVLWIGRLRAGSLGPVG